MMEQCPKCSSSRIRQVPRRYSGWDMAFGSSISELQRINSKWGLCDDCNYHWSSKDPNRGYVIKPMKKFKTC